MIPPSATQGGGGGETEPYQVLDSSHGSGSYSQSNYDFQYSRQQQQMPQQSSEPTNNASLPPNSTPTSTAPSSQHTPAPGTPANSSEFKPPLQPNQPKRLHVSNVPFRFREPDLRQLFYVSWCLVCACVCVVKLLFTHSIHTCRDK